MLLSQICVVLLGAFSLTTTPQIKPHTIAVYDDELDTEVNRITGAVADKAEKEFGIKLEGCGASMPNNVFYKFNLSFRVEKPLNKIEIKKMLAEIARMTIDMSTASSIMKRYAADPVFDVNIVSINLFFYRTDGYVYTYPNYCCAGLSEGRYDFRTLENEGDFKYKTTETE